MPSARGKLAFAPDGRQRSENNIYQPEKPTVFGADVSRVAGGFVRLASGTETIQRGFGGFGR